ncbi:thioesterase II family protein [Roseimaritima ulvae]|uniref:Linear gramicidin dehydrogenase LgrE n=1 Tax=Roseimaritima ulvae TaxID=980254 RepID=A0A5B9R6S7_9BACT|nr:alpha/beta fold hydrolase [Roseimaritima ulvae]QEG42311.1 Linear gramicidin dehydrogenase LgrE [Roseimaritima ulvae]
MSLSERWGIRKQPAATCRLRLVCFPFSGTGVSAFHGWRSHLPDWIDFCPLALPGREVRYREPPFTDVATLVEEVCPLLLESRDLPLALYGHSVGALLAFELAQRMTRQAAPPVHLFLAACRPPHLPNVMPPLHGIEDDEEFLANLQVQYRRLPDVVLRDATLLASLVRTLRADLTMFETYRCTEPQMLDCPLTVMGGTQDWFAIEELAQWDRYTTGGSKVEMLPGDHFFMQTCPEQLTAQILADLQVR